MDLLSSSTKLLQSRLNSRLKRHLWIRLLVLTVATLAGVEAVENRAMAQEDPSVARAASEGTLRSTLIDGYDTPTMGDFRFNMSVKSTTTSGRVEELQTENARRFRMRTEYAVGAVHQVTGWGLTATAATSGAAFGDSKRTAFGAADPSIIIVHPRLFDNGTIRVSGQFRKYFAVTDRARSRGVDHYAYYVTTSARFARGWSGFNQFVPRTFLQETYRPEETTVAINNITGIAKQTLSWLRVGCGSHLAMEFHHGTETGTSAELFPFATFTVSRNITIEPRIYIPIHKDNAVNESARSVSLNNTAAELSAQISL